MWRGWSSESRGKKKKEGKEASYVESHHEQQDAAAGQDGSRWLHGSRAERLVPGLTKWRELRGIENCDRIGNRVKSGGKGGNLGCEKQDSREMWNGMGPMRVEA